MIVFGDAPPGETRERAGSYAVIVDDRWRVAVVRIGAGVFLPGGDREPEETAEAAMRRGVRSATGLELEVFSVLGHANDWGGSPILRVASFFLCRPRSDGGKVEWLRGSEALASLTLASDRWVTGRALGPC
jgi:ADP-ribose pyrophosphatase YjhB (NUDIX family)